jgi:hypothetical protein
VAISMLVYISKGNAKLVNHKLKLGAILIGLTATVVSCRPVVTCYDPAPPPDNFTFTADSFDQYAIVLKLPADSILKGRVYDPTKTQYSYLIEDKSTIEKYRDDVVAEDGVYNSSSENIIVRIPKDLDTGSYKLKIYTGEKTQINTANFIHLEFLKIIK